jgi:hypothetical protein
VNNFAPPQAMIVGTPHDAARVVSLVGLRSDNIQGLHWSFPELAHGIPHDSIGSSFPSAQSLPQCRDLRWCGDGERKQRHRQGSLPEMRELRVWATKCQFGVEADIALSKADWLAVRTLRLNNFQSTAVSLRSVSRQVIGSQKAIGDPSTVVACSSQTPYRTYAIRLGIGSEDTGKGTPICASKLNPRRRPNTFSAELTQIDAKLVEDLIKNILTPLREYAVRIVDAANAKEQERLHKEMQKHFRSTIKDIEDSLRLLDDAVVKFGKLARSK